MKAHLLYPDRDFDPEREPPSGAQALVDDLGLDTLVQAMADGDEFLHGVAEAALLASLDDRAAIEYRQAVLADCLAHREVVREIYDLAVEALAREHQVWGVLARLPETVLHHAVEVLEVFVEMLRRLRAIDERHAAEFRSPGFGTFFAMIAAELDDEYFAVVEDHLARLRFRDGVLLSARPGPGGKARDYTLRKPETVSRGWFGRIAGRDRSGFSFVVPDRDEAGNNALTELRGRGINLVANALAQSTDHILAFFRMLRTELGFYVGCLNAHERLTGKGEPLCQPTMRTSDSPALRCTGLYDPGLSLNLDGRVTGNDVTAEGASLIVITGANEGGKSTFLRSVGLAQLMAHCGMFVPASSYESSVCSGLFSHFKREEDATMSSGKLDEELARMSEIADDIRPGCVLLSNESFAATNEREGSQLAREIIRAMVEAGVRVFVVTHLFDLASGLHRDRRDGTLFLRAERMPDGRRSFRLVEGEPLPTSFGEDVYERVFGASGEAVADDAAR